MNDDLDKALDDLLAESQELFPAKNEQPNSVVEQPIVAPTLSESSTAETIAKEAKASETNVTRRNAVRPPRQTKRIKSWWPWALGSIVLIAIANGAWYWFLQNMESEDYYDDDFKIRVSDEDFHELLFNASDEYLDSILKADIFENPPLKMQDVAEVFTEPASEALVESTPEPAAQPVEEATPEIIVEAVAEPVAEPEPETRAKPTAIAVAESAPEVIVAETHHEIAEQPDAEIVTEASPEPAAQPSAKEVTEVAEQATSESPQVYTPRAQSSVVLTGISGPLQQGKSHIQFRCDLALFSQEKALGASIKNFEEAIRAVTANIFYFTDKAKPQIPELEYEIMQKINFIFPQGKIIQVKLHNLTLEMSKS